MAKIKSLSNIDEVNKELVDMGVYEDSINIMAPKFLF